MQRRIALSLSLAFTTVVMFAMVAVGAQAGFFSEQRSAAASPAVASAGAATDTVAAAPVPEDPIIVTDYVYIDEPGAPMGIRVPKAAAVATSAEPKIEQPEAPRAPASEPVSVSAQPSQPSQPSPAPVAPRLATTSKPKSISSAASGEPHEREQEHERESGDD